MQCMKYSFPVRNECSSENFAEHARLREGKALAVESTGMIFSMGLPETQSVNDARSRKMPVGNRRKRIWRSFWRTGIVMVSSAALGGVAVALWNRRTLNEMRREADYPNEE